MDPSERVLLGRTRLTVTRLGLGTAPLGGLFEAVADRRAHATVERAYETGLRFFDTAPLYGYGLAEQRIGHVLRGKPRGEYVLSTKVGRLLRAGAPPDLTQFDRGKPFYQGTPDVSPIFDFSYDGVMRSIEESLTRLELDRVDILHIHDPDAHYPEACGGAYRALDHLRREGTIAAVGAGMNQAELLERFVREVDLDCVLVAGRYTLLDQAALGGLLPACRARQVAVIVGGVYNSGILADPRMGATFDYVPAPPGLVAKAQHIHAICQRHGVPLKAAALQFPFGHPAVSAVLIGCRSSAEVDENIQCLRYPIPAALWENLRRERLLPADAPLPGEGGDGA
ncbi:MAG TPA: aldo/keto reductase [bacterium]|nr:aldo/keto reductase [bacterium]